MTLSPSPNTLQGLSESYQADLQDVQAVVGRLGCSGHQRSEVFWQLSSLE